MRGKVGLVIGLGVGYVLGTRAGRERYEQIKLQAEKVWNLPPVQEQVGKVQDAAKSALMALPTAVWNSAVKVTRATTGSSRTPGERLDAGLDAAQDAADDVAAAAEAAAADVKKRVGSVDDATDGK
ncbi:hypothetical protein LK09_00115 [Microbacterium mangrovi]|uniref:Protoporphyrinogen oxidase n=1 Tax=Microbacterium mangrovi TaxID=1348253 RepID=A0A0B2A9E7_9MICO|nr:hypothetical protein [Microbacterium mangrovi]KHK99799.1 hypothetical protein LK09_00115 [Microbacterium mangrovi]